MQLSRRAFMSGLAAAGISWSQTARNQVVKYVRYEHQGATSYGILEGDSISQIRGGLFGSRTATGTKVKLGAVKLLWPCEPSKVLAVGLNYKSHLGNRPAPTKPELFFKPITSLLEPEGKIVIPAGARNLHYEGELVIVIGKKAKRVSASEAAGCVFGYTCGNDLSERDWQRDDLQWWRAKGADTFGPLGPAIAVGLDYPKSRIQTRVNGQVKQSQMLSDLLFDSMAIVSFASQYVTLEPGDVIYTGTPGSTSALAPGDTVEVEIDGIGILRNKVAGS
jgi:2-keto-4-pentenoate hydratase/2-oxohepta-3-ene-1,7-dioic acid hydratase in catechol pathway